MSYRLAMAIRHAPDLAPAQAWPPSIIGVMIDIGEAPTLHTTCHQDRRGVLILSAQVSRTPGPLFPERDSEALQEEKYGRGSEA